MRALVVDDSAPVRTQLVEHLAQLGMPADQASSATEAAALLGAQTPDVVLLDWTLPDTSGLEFLRWLRSDARHQHTPVIMLTGEGELPFVTEALDAGANEYLHKPFDAQSLLEKLLLLGVDPEQRRAA